MRQQAKGAAVLDTIERALTTLVRHANLPRLQGRMLEAAGVSMDRASYPVLRYVAALGPVRIGDLVQALAVDFSTVSRQVRQLESAGFVARAGDSSDGRVSVIALTPNGASVMERVGDARRRVLSNIVVGWTPEERAMFAELLNRFADGIVGYGEGV